MRRFISIPVVAVALTVANPALANSGDDPDNSSESEMIEQLNDPVFQDGLADMFGGFMAAMMDVPIGPFVTAVEKAIPGGAGASDIDPDATVGDLARRDDPDFDRNMTDGVRKGTAMMGITASEFGALLPQLKAITEKIKRRMDDID
ncbi:hypothetical protein [Parasphingorhabdus halotolerans]|uniref:Uncharacterized protein n=1 Tax=Parasphingorhabdus halotolerans TaxID=2725558 RepID=A0A6H2DPF6_9SPHN|nr:hypothetical protein [Parasphingorhabdus halotolerans]QJB69845.1 hypothetical protein HF685_11615 [Parasphingorhabdus halotolerans]